MACRAMKTPLLLSLLLLSVLAPEKAKAAVSETRENSFTIETTVMVDATPASTCGTSRGSVCGGIPRIPGRARPRI